MNIIFYTKKILIVVIFLPDYSNPYVNYFCKHTENNILKIFLRILNFIKILEH